jgi:hypothetical protein
MAAPMGFAGRRFKVHMAAYLGGNLKLVVTKYLKT